MRLSGHLLARWDRLRAAYWFIPAVMATLAATLAIALPRLDAHLGTAWIDGAVWAHASRPEGARAMLSAIAASMISVAGVVFATTIATVTFASAQLGPRLLSNFMRDRRNQVVLGTFTATYLYCLLVMRTIESSEGARGELVREAFVPNIAVLVGLGLAVTSVGVLIFFIHHAPRSVHAATVTAQLGEGLVRRLLHGRPGTRGGRRGARAQQRSDDETGTLAPDLFVDFALPGSTWTAAEGVGQRPDAGHRVAAPQTGYVQVVDYEALCEAATRHDLTVHLPRTAGAFVTAGAPLLVARPRDRLSDEAASDLVKAFTLGDQRTPAQDPLFLADELCEIAIRALSPGINDPFTAMTCLDWLGSASIAIARAPELSGETRDGDGVLRLVGEAMSFARFCERVFSTVRPYVAADRNATLHAVRVFGQIASAVHRDADRRTLRAHLDALTDAAAPSLRPTDRDALADGRAAVMRLLTTDAALPDVLPAAP